MRTPEEEQAIRARSRELRARAGAGEWPPHGRPARRPGARSLPGVWAEMEVGDRWWFLEGWPRWRPGVLADYRARPPVVAMTPAREIPGWLWAMLPDALRDEMERRR